MADPITTKIGDVSAYLDAVAHGFEGTRAEFGELLANSANYAQSAANSAASASTAAATASTKAGEATTAATDAQTAKVQTEQAASQALMDIGTTKAIVLSDIDTAKSTAVSVVQSEGQTQTENARTQAQAASQSATAAQASATTASTKASEASQSATTATTKATEAAASATSAEQSASDAHDVLESIPQDYSELSEDVSKLKADLADVPNHPVKSAEQLISDKRTVDKVPYKYRASASGKSDRAYDMIVGGTVCFNQIAQNGDFSNGTNGWGTNGTQYGTLSASDGICTYTIGSTQSNLTYIARLANLISGHAYACIAGINPSKQTSCRFLHSGIADGSASKVFTANTWGELKTVVKTKQDVPYATIYVNTASDLQENDTVAFKNIMFMDLTAMFGTAIADHIYSLEQATVGAGVALFRAMFPNDYYAYNAGSLISVEGLSAKEVVGFNLFDEIFELGTISESTGNDASSTTRKRSKNYIHIFPNTEFYSNAVGTLGLRFYDSSKNYVGSTSVGSNRGFTSPSNAWYLRIVTAALATADEPVCINLTSDKNGTYEPYRKTTYPLDNSLTLRGVPVLKDGKIEFDGDTYEADGTVTRRYGIVDLGTLNWSLYGEHLFYSSALSTVAKGNGNLLAVGYSKGDVPLDSPLDLTMRFMPTGNNAILRMVNYAYNDATTFKTAMSGVYLVYELATPTTEEAIPYTNPQVVSPYGTEEYISTSVCPVGHITEYPDNLRAKLDGLPWDLSMIAPVEASYTATRNYTTGQLLIVDNMLYKVTANIANGGTITPNSNVTATTLSEVIASLS